MNQEWRSWKEQHEKIYTDQVEEGVRRSTWLENKRLVEEHNKNESHGYTLSLNHFADLVRHIINNNNKNNNNNK